MYLCLRVILFSYAMNVFGQNFGIEPFVFYVLGYIVLYENDPRMSCSKRLCSKGASSLCFMSYGVLESCPLCFMFLFFKYDDTFLFSVPGCFDLIGSCTKSKSVLSSLIIPVVFHAPRCHKHIVLVCRECINTLALSTFRRVQKRLEL